MIDKTVKFIVISSLLIVILPIVLLLGMIGFIMDLFKDPNKPMTKEEYYGRW